MLTFQLYSFNADWFVLVIVVIGIIIIIISNSSIIAAILCCTHSRLHSHERSWGLLWSMSCNGFLLWSPSCTVPVSYI